MNDDDPSCYTFPGNRKSNEIFYLCGKFDGNILQVIKIMGMTTFTKAYFAVVNLY